MQASTFIAFAALSVALPNTLYAQNTNEHLTPNAIVNAAPSADWRQINPTDLLILTLAPDEKEPNRTIVIQLMPAPFSTGWIENIRTLAQNHWWDGTSVYRVTDNGVAQWGSSSHITEGSRTSGKPLPAGIRIMPEADYVTQVMPGDDDGRDYILTPQREDIVINRWIDSYTVTAFVAGWPIGLDDQGGRTAWPIHCYGSVGVMRDLPPDTGSGAELYAVIGHAPRAMDRNVAVVGRVIEGIEHLSTLPRGQGEAGFYANEADRVPIISVRLASDLPENERPQFEHMATNSQSFARYLSAQANRRDAFFQTPADGLDICSAPVPVRRITPPN